MANSAFDQLAKMAANTEAVTFAETITYEPQSGGSYETSAIFEKSHEFVETDGNVEFSTAKPVIWLRYTEVDALSAPVPKQDDVFIIDGDSYVAVDVQPDGRALYQIVLMVA